MFRQSSSISGRLVGSSFASESYYAFSSGLSCSVHLRISSVLLMPFVITTQALLFCCCECELYRNVIVAVDDDVVALQLSSTAFYKIASFLSESAAFISFYCTLAKLSTKQFVGTTESGSIFVFIEFDAIELLDKSTLVRYFSEKGELSFPEGLAPSRGAFYDDR